MRKETVFSIQDLRRVSITCSRCGTEVILDMAQFQRDLSGNPNVRSEFAPRQCPACRIPYDSSLHALEDLQRAYSLLSKLEGVVTFRAETQD